MWALATPQLGQYYSIVGDYVKKLLLGINACINEGQITEGLHLLAIYSLKQDNHTTYWPGCIVTTTPFDQLKADLTNRAVTHV